VREALDLLAAQAPTMGQVLAGSTRLWYVILDGTRIRIDRVAEDRPYYSGQANTSATASTCRSRPTREADPRAHADLAYPGRRAEHHRAIPPPTPPAIA